VGTWGERGGAGFAAEGKSCRSRDYACSSASFGAVGEGAFSFRVPRKLLEVQACNGVTAKAFAVANTALHIKDSVNVRFRLMNIKQGGVFNENRIFIEARGILQRC
jgi:hypothetical protein